MLTLHYRPFDLVTSTKGQSHKVSFFKKKKINLSGLNLVNIFYDLREISSFVVTSFPFRGDNCCMNFLKYVFRKLLVASGKVDKGRRLSLQHCCSSVNSE